MLTIENLSLAFGTQTVLKNLSLHLPKGEIAALIGRSGSGKTTLFKMLTGLLPAEPGCLRINSLIAPEAQRHISYMMQEDLLLPWRTVLENLMLVGELGKCALRTSALKDEALFFLEEVGLTPYAHAYPHTLSGGMRQRVSLARALLQKKPLILLDEPFGALDAVLREQMHDLLRTVQQRHGVTIMLITHDFRDALALSDRVFLLANGSIAKEWTLERTVQHDPTYLHALAEELRTALQKKACSTVTS